MYFKLFLFVVACIVASISATTDAKDAVEGQFKYQAYISKTDQITLLMHICGGVILNEWYIVTSAACVHAFVSTPEKIVAFFGTIRIHLDAQKGEIAEINLPHGNGGKVNESDVALLKMKNQIKISNNVQPVNLPETSNFEGIKPIFSGIGYDSVRLLSE